MSLNKMIAIKLTKEQKKYLKAIQWLYNGPRASGRTTLLAYVLIGMVIETGQDMRIVDHYPSVHSDRHLAEMIQHLIEDNHLPLEITYSRLMLKKIK